MNSLSSTTSTRFCIDCPRDRGAHLRMRCSQSRRNTGNKVRVGDLRSRGQRNWPEWRGVDTREAHAVVGGDGAGGRNGWRRQVLQRARGNSGQEQRRGRGQEAGAGHLHQPRGEILMRLRAMPASPLICAICCRDCWRHCRCRRRSWWARCR